MANKSVLSTLPTAWIAVTSLVILSCAGSASGAQSDSADYTFVLGSGFLCDPTDSSSCPAIAKATQGESYEVSGAGRFDAQDKSVKAAGTFSHKSASGHVLEAGVWTASELISFASYGIAPGALLHEKVALGPPQFGRPMRTTKVSAPMPTGGLGIFRIFLVSTSGATKTAVLQMNCALGDVPHERSIEGIRLTFGGSGNEFSEEVSGRVIFLAVRPEAKTPNKSPEQKPATGSAEPPSS
jgi:hypothetical protein